MGENSAGRLAGEGEGFSAGQHGERQVPEGGSGVGLSHLGKAGGGVEMSPPRLGAAPDRFGSARRICLALRCDPVGVSRPSARSERGGVDGRGSAPATGWWFV